MRLLPALTISLLLLIFLTLGATGPVRGQTVSDDQGPASAVDITLVGPDAALAPVREVTADLLSRDDVAVLWRRADKVRVEDVIEAPPGGRIAPVVVWVDVSSGIEARIYFRAAAGRRFVIRRVSLPSGVGPLAAEEIAQVIQSVRRALASDPAWALSLAEARTALSVSAGERRPPPAATPTAPLRARVTTAEIGAGVVGWLYAPGLPFAGDLDISASALWRVATAPPSAWPGSFGGRLVIGYGIPAHFASGAVGADLRVAKLRVAAVWEPWRAGRVAIRLGLGGGADWVEFKPTAEMPGAAPAPGGTFFTPLACADAALHVEISPRFALVTAFRGEISLDRVHYDAYDAAGNRGEVLVPYRVRPGLTIGMGVRL